MSRFTQFIYFLFALGGVVLIFYGAATVRLGLVFAVLVGAIILSLWSRPRYDRYLVGTTGNFQRGR